MRKLQIGALSALLGIGAMGFAQNAEVAPVSVPSNQTSNATTAQFDLLFNYEIGDEIGSNGNAGVAFINNEIWVSAWASGEIRILTADGVYLETITIPGVTGIRSFTSDGTFIYAGNASNSIFEIDPVDRSLESTIVAAVSTTAKTRMTAYDPNLDGGNGGFWLGDFNSDFSAVSRTGAELRVIPRSAHAGNGVYGGAVDVFSEGGPYIWVFEQQSSQAIVRQVNLATGMPTGVEYDYNTSGHQPGGNTSIAGGLFISSEIVPGKVTMMGIGQGTPTDQLFGVEIMDSAGVNDNALAAFSLYPNPASGIVTIESPVHGDKAVAVYDMLGKQVLNTVVSGNTLNISTLQTGVYMVSVTQKGTAVTKKLIVK